LRRSAKVTQCTRAARLHRCTMTQVQYHYDTGAVSDGCSIAPLHVCSMARVHLRMGAVSDGCSIGWVWLVWSRACIVWLVCTMLEGLYGASNAHRHRETDRSRDRQRGEEREKKRPQHEDATSSRRLGGAVLCSCQSGTKPARARAPDQGKAPRPHHRAPAPALLRHAPGTRQRAAHACAEPQGMSCARRTWGLVA